MEIISTSYFYKKQYTYKSLNEVYCKENTVEILKYNNTTSIIYLNEVKTIKVATKKQISDIINNYKLCEIYNIVDVDTEYGGLKMVRYCGDEWRVFNGYDVINTGLVSVGYFENEYQKLFRKEKFKMLTEI